MNYTEQGQYDIAVTIKDLILEFGEMTGGEITSTDLAAMIEVYPALIKGAYNVYGAELGITRRRNKNNFWTYSLKE